MKEKVIASVVQFNPEWLQPGKNAERMAKFVEEEAKKGAELIVFPELANVGYINPPLPGLKPSFDAETTAAQFIAKYVKASELVPGPTTDRLSTITKKYGVYVVVGMSRLHPVIPDTIFNSGILIGPSGVVSVCDKIHMAANEKHFFYPGDSIDAYETGLGNIGIVICYDARFCELTRILALKGAEIICWIANIVYVGKVFEPTLVERRSSVRAMENSYYVLACSRAGHEGDASFVGHSAVAAPNGEIIAQTDSQEEEVITAELYNEEVIKARTTYLPVFQDRRPELYSLITERRSYPSYAPIQPPPPAPEEEST